MATRHLNIGLLLRTTLISISLLLSVTMLAQLPPASFHQLRRDVDVFSSMYNSIAEDQRGFIWFGSAGGGGLYRYDGYSIKPFVFDPRNIDESISTTLIQSIKEINDTLILVGTFFGYSTLNPITGKIRSFNNNVEALENPSAGVTYDFLVDSTHRKIWVATNFGLGVIDMNTDQFSMLHPAMTPSNAVEPQQLQHIERDFENPDKLYVAGRHGFYVYTISLNHLETITCPLPGQKNLYIHSLSPDPHGKFWLTTGFGSILRYNPTLQQWRDYTVCEVPGDEVSPCAVYDLLYVDSTQVWFASQFHVGILHTDSGQLEIWSHDPQNPGGLLPNHGYRSLLKDRHGRLWVGSRNGVQYARQAFLPKSDSEKSVRVEIVELEVRPILEKRESPLLYRGSLKLEQPQRDLTIQYVLPNPLQPNNVTYQYKLDGYDKDWIATDQRSVRYARMRGGTFTFRIKAQEGDNGVWSEESTFNIIIPKRLTEHVWFWIGAVLCAVGLLWFLFHFFVTRARQQTKLKADFELQLSEIQMQALRAQMNPHFLFNSLNSIKYFAISKSKDETASYLSKFALLVRTILTNSKSRTISLKDELDALRLYIEIEHLRLEGKFEYVIDIDSSIHIQQAQIPPMILQPFVENAIWHGLMHIEKGGMLKVLVRDMGRQIQCVIEDNGIGRAKSAELKKSQMSHRKSEGMQITADRIALINRIYQIKTEVDVIDLEHPDGTAAGTRVVIHIPLIRDEEE